MRLNIASSFVIFAASACGLCRAADLPKLPQADRPLAERFADPPASARIIRILHKQADDLTAQDKVLRQLAAQGFGGFVGNVAFDGYLEDEAKWTAFLRGVREAKAAGMSLWLYDERGYPSGSAGGLTLRDHPEWAARGLLVAQATASAGEVVLDVPPGKLVVATALPVRDGIIVLDQARDLAANVSGGKLRWTAPTGEWCVMAMTDDLIFENTHAALSLAYKLPCINMLEPEPTARFLEVTHDRYAARLGNDLGRWFVSTFTDEPSLMNVWLRPMPYRVLPWSPKFATEFEKRRGAPLRPLLPALVADAGPPGAKARYDFWLTVAALVSENYFGQIQKWCGRHHVLSGGHLLAEESLTSHVPYYGDFFRCMRRLDAPGIDCLTSVPSQVPWFTARLISSVADLEGRTVTMCETSDHAQRYRPPGDTRPVYQVSEDEIRGTCNRLILGGINTITSYYAFTGLKDDQLRRINLHVGRCATMLAGGHQVADIAVLYPIESIWPKFTPGLRGATETPGAKQVEQAYYRVWNSLYGANRDFTFVDSRALAEASAQNDALVHGKLRWRVIVLPATDTLPLAAWENLARFWQNGGILIAAGTLPANSDQQFPSPRVQALAREMFGDGGALRAVSNKAGGVGVYLPPNMLSFLPTMLDRLIERDATVANPRSPLRATHRRVDGHDVYFVVNDGGAPCDEKVHLCGQGPGEQWNPETGQMSPLPDGKEVAVQLGPYGAMLFRFPEARPPQRRGGANAASPSFVAKPLPSVKPVVGKGEFVRAELTGDEKAGWCAAATLTKSRVDTHLFLSCNFAQPLDLSRADGLTLETTVPEKQTTHSQLLVILVQKNGAQYLAGSGRRLDLPGRIRTQVLLSDFSLAGWSKDPGGRLDLSQITAIRVGWGGYFGEEGEKIEFTLNGVEEFQIGAQ